MENFLQENVPLRHLLKSKPPFMSWRRSAFNEVNDWDHSDTFDIQDDNDSGKMHCRQNITQKIEKRDDYVTFYRDLDAITLKCSKSKPCRLVIQGKNWLLFLKNVI